MPWDPASHTAWAAVKAAVKRVQAEPDVLVQPWKLYATSPDPLPAVLLLSLWASTATLVLGVATDEYSWVDRIWSITPWIYAWGFALHPLVRGETTPTDLPFDRLTVMAVLATLWGIRLTYNFARKGGYAPGGEDYRWAHVRASKWFNNPIVWQLFHAGFVAFFQNGLLCLIACPAYVAWLHRDKTPTLTRWDGACIGLFLFFLLMETVADEQQWRFQQAKKQAMSRRPVRAAARRASLASPTGKTRAAAKEEGAPLLEGELLDGFCQSGLFKISRHPNFFAEQAIWWAFHLFSYAATLATAGKLSPPYVNWTVIGPFLLTLLFQGSTGLTEKLTLKKYPRYRAYMKTTSRLLPWKPKEHRD